MTPDQPSFDYGVAASALESLPRAVRARRDLLGLSLRAAAEQVGTSYGTIARIEWGNGVHSSAAVALMRWLDAAPVEADFVAICARCGRGMNPGDRMCCPAAPVGVA